MPAAYSIRAACMPGSDHAKPAADKGGEITSSTSAQILMSIGFIVLLLLAAALSLHQMGRVSICKCGTIRFWHGVVASSENSQHLSDWYSLSHIVHGFLFYGATWLVARATGWRIPFVIALAVAVLLETAWEIFENTDFVINRYREATISLDYYGDSIVNSVTDIVAMIVGFVLASALPVLISVVLILGLEFFAAIMIRDNLLLNIIMLLHPVDVIRNWQQGG